MRFFGVDVSIPTVHMLAYAIFSLGQGMASAIYRKYMPTTSTQDSKLLNTPSECCITASDPNPNPTLLLIYQTYIYYTQELVAHSFSSLYLSVVEFMLDPFLPIEDSSIARSENIPASK